jgi:hypothetical protein
MSKFNTSTARARNGNGPIQSETTPTLLTANGAAGFARDAQSELFLAAVSDFGGENTFYEKASDRTSRINRLTHEVAVADPEWLASFTLWLREEANMRTASLTVALEGAKALNKAGVSGGRQIVTNAIRRADEAGEALAYWFAAHGRKMPSAVKRGIADGAIKSFNEYSLAKYDTSSHAFRFGDIIELTHPSPKDDRQSELFKFALDRRRDSSAAPGETLSMLQKRAEFLALSTEKQLSIVHGEGGAEKLKDAGITWEVLSSALGKGNMDGKAWEAMIPSMGYMALLRNLRNFEDKGVSDAVLDQVAARISDPAEVAKSRQLPFRFLAAYRANSGSLRFGYPLEKALKASLANVPELDGNTLVLVDQSGSMFMSQSEKTEMTYADTAAIFGTAIALRSKNATLVQFGGTSQEIPLKKSDSVLKTVEKFHDMGGTCTYDAIKRHYVPGKHTRVVLITDEQANGQYHRLTGSDPRMWSSYTTVRGDVLDALPATVPTYTWNLAGYAAGHGASKANRTYFGGLSDQAFKLIPLLERGHDAGWPWETK